MTIKPKRFIAPLSTRIILETGWATFILPEGTSADAMSILANAIKVETSYNQKPKYSVSTSSGEIKVSIVDINDIGNFVDVRKEDDHQEYDIIIDEVKKQLQNEVDRDTHAVVYFGSENIKIGSEEIQYENLANPKNDPQEIIDFIVEKARANPHRKI